MTAVSSLQRECEHLFLQSSPKTVQVFLYRCISGSGTCCWGNHLQKSL